MPSVLHNSVNRGQDVTCWSVIRKISGHLFVVIGSQMETSFCSKHQKLQRFYLQTVGRYNLCFGKYNQNKK